MLSVHKLGGPTLLSLLCIQLLNHASGFQVELVAAYATNQLRDIYQEHMMTSLL